MRVLLGLVLLFALPATAEAMCDRLSRQDAVAAAVRYQDAQLRQGLATGYELSERVHRKTSRRVTIWFRAFGVPGSDGSLWDVAQPMYVQVKHGRVHVGWVGWIDDEPYSERCRRNGRPYLEAHGLLRPRN